MVGNEEWGEKIIFSGVDWIYELLDYLIMRKKDGTLTGSKVRDF